MMTKNSECIVCSKHKDFAQVTGEVLLDLGGFKMSHFPILDGALATRGHLLIESSRHISRPEEMTLNEAISLGAHIKLGSEALQSLCAPEHIYIFRINDKVAHFHTHLIPRYAGAPQEFWGGRIMDNPEAPKIDLEEVRRVSRELRSYIEKSRDLKILREKL